MNHKENEPVCQQSARSVPGLYAAHCPRLRTSKTQSLHDAEVRKKHNNEQLVHVTDLVSGHSHRTIYKKKNQFSLHAY